MKFLRLAFYVLIAQLVLSGCAGEAVEETSSSSSSEINFDAYVGRNASTRSSITDLDTLKFKGWPSGFGVFAIYRHTDKTIPPLMLMNNEHVYWKNWKGDHPDWGYEHTRYWPSEGFVDFYAFAPHSDVPQLVNKPGGTEPNPTYIYFPSNESPVDLVYANAKDRTKTNEPVKFTFNHALARLGFDITANQGLEKNGAVITVEEVKLYGESDDKGAFDITGYLNLKIKKGEWNLVQDVDTRAVYTWTPTGLKNGTSCFKLSASQLDYTCEKIENAPNSYLCIIPQVKYFPFYLQITYKVKQGEFQDEVTVKKDLLEVRNPPGVSNPSFSFEMGKAYVFHLKLSLDPINFNVTTDVVNWGEQ